MFIHKYDLRTGLFQRLTYGHTSTYINDISQDGHYLLFSRREPNLTERPFSRTYIYKMDLRTMHVDTLIKGEKFVSRAPEAKIAEERAKLEKYTQMMEQVKARLAQLVK